MFKSVKNWLWDSITSWLNATSRSGLKQQPINHFEHMLVKLKPADVILFEGRSRVSEVIKIITLSHWTHAAIYIGRLEEISNPRMLTTVKKHYSGDPSEPLVIESLLGYGTIINPLSKYSKENLRICRPAGLSKVDQLKVISFASEHLGLNYAVRELLDLARFMFPYSMLPRQWRSSLFQHNAGKPTSIVCSSMIARCFQSVNFPILPIVETETKERIKLRKRNFKLFTPTDFDYSPYFEVIKFPVIPLANSISYHDLPWEDDNEAQTQNKETEMQHSYIG